MKTQAIEARRHGGTEARRAGAVRRSGAWVAALACCVLFVVVPMASADTVKIGGAWIPDVVISDIYDGRLLWTNSLGTPFERRLEEIEGIGLDANPQVRAGHEAMEKGDFKGAVTQFTAARAKSREKWAQAWIDAQLVTAHEKAGQPREATLKFLELATSGADVRLLRPPLLVVQGADDALKNDLKPRVEAALTAAKDPQAQELIKQLQGVLGGGTVQQQQQAAEAVAAAAAATRKPGDDLPADPAIAMPIAIEEFKGDPIVRDLWLGNFQEALAKADAELSRPTRRLSLLLYLRGVAQLGLADATGDQNRYKDAALSFMRVVVHFPRSAWVAASRVETGYVHLKINRPAIARKQFEIASPMIDAEEDPRYAGRLEALTAELANLEQSAVQ